MLYVKFKINNPDHIIAIKNMFNYLVINHSDEYIMKDHEDFFDLEERLEIRSKGLFNGLFLEDSQTFLKYYFEYLNGKDYDINKSIAYLFSYLDNDFEVEFTDLEINDNILTLHYNALSYPFGGIEKLLAILKSFGGEPEECYNGFDVFQFKWISDFDYEAIILPEKTKDYKKEMKID